MDESVKVFGVADYIAFVALLVVSALIGVYYGFFGGKMSTSQYLVGNRNMASIPVGMSLVASFISGIFLLGTATEVYLYGIHFWYSVISLLIMALVFGTCFLPVFHELRITTVFEYLEMRFGRSVRMLACILSGIYTIVVVPIIIYVPSLAFNQMTGISIYYVATAVSLICIFYTCVGGVKAVVWTDVIQLSMMVASMLLITVKGTIDVGGLGVVLERNFNTKRLELPQMEFDLTKRYTLWSFVFGYSFYCILSHGVNQGMVQRYLCLPTLKVARRTLFFHIFGMCFMTTICCYSGLLLYATYHECDPLKSRTVKAKDQLMPFLAMHILGDFKGLAGIFIAGVFSAALSSLSTILNSTAGVFLQDLYKPFAKKLMTEKQENYLMKAVVVVLGFICLVLVLVVEKLGPVLQMTTALLGAVNGPLLAIFAIGVLLPWVTTKATMIGCTLAFIFSSWIAIGAQLEIASDNSFEETKYLSIDGCSFNMTSHNVNFTLNSPSSSGSWRSMFKISFLWYTTVGFIVSVIIAVIINIFTNSNDVSSMNPKLFSPFVRQLLPRKKFDPSGVDEKLLNVYVSMEHKRELEVVTSKWRTQYEDTSRVQVSSTEKL